MIKTLLLISIFFIEIFSQSNVQQLQQRIDNLLIGEFLEQSQIAVSVYDLTERKNLYQKNHKLLLHPASNMKVLTSAAGLLFLGAEYQFKTSIYYTGAIVNKTLYGDLYVVGGCDPDFTSADLDSLIFQIESLGIKEISGSLIGDKSMTDSIFWGQGWMWDDDPSTDSPYLSAFVINDNALKITVKGGKAGSPAIVETDPLTNFVEIINQTETVLSGRPNDFNVTRDWLNRKNTIIVKGRVSEGYNRVGPPSFVRLNLFSPENYFMTLLEEGLLRKGITANGGQKFESLSPIAVPIYNFERSYDTVIVNLNKISDNLSAEMTLLAMGEKILGKPSDARKGIRLVDSLISLAGLKPQTYRLVDGSGLSHYNLVSAELMVEVLKYIFYYQPGLFQRLYTSFPIAGVDGTLRCRMHNTKAAANVYAKTGTLSGVSGLSGYVTAANGNQIAFSILVQNFVGSTENARFYQDKICELLAEYF